jgi:mRNA (2'-O-methyladenosine-N6-)-methyltransferase
MTSLTAHRSFLAETLARQSTRREIIDTTHAWLPQPVVRGHSSSDHAEAGPSKRNVINYVPEEETVRNDLTERYVSSGEFGSNYILGAADKEICEE